MHPCGARRGFNDNKSLLCLRAGLAELRRRTETLRFKLALALEHRPSRARKTNCDGGEAATSTVLRLQVAHGPGPVGWDASALRLRPGP